MNRLYEASKMYGIGDDFINNATSDIEYLIIIMNQISQHTSAMSSSIKNIKLTG